MNKALLLGSPQCKTLEYLPFSHLYERFFTHFTQTFHPLSSYSPKVSLAIQQSPVLGDLGLQFHLDVEQMLILPSFDLDVVADTCELLLQLQDDHVVLLHLHVVTPLNVAQVGLQGRFL